MRILSTRRSEPRNGFQELVHTKSVRKLRAWSPRDLPEDGSELGTNRFLKQ
jgi:hypothetical protein